MTTRPLQTGKNECDRNIVTIFNTRDYCTFDNYEKLTAKRADHRVNAKFIPWIHNQFNVFLLLFINNTIKDFSVKTVTGRFFEDGN